MAFYATRNRDDALDLVQDAMMRLADKYPDRPDDEWAPLFYRILERRITDWHRRQKLARLLFGRLPGRDEDKDDDPGSLPDPRGLTPERELAGAEGMAALEAGIAALPLRQQQVFLLREMQGFDVRQTAEIMQCSIGSVKTHYFRAQQALRARLEDFVE